MIFGGDRKDGRILLFNEKKLCLKRIKGRTQVRRELEVGTLLLGNDKNNIIADKVLSYF